MMNYVENASGGSLNPRPCFFVDVKGDIDREEQCLYSKRNLIADFGDFHLGFRANMTAQVFFRTSLNQANGKVRFLLKKKTGFENLRYMLKI